MKSNGNSERAASPKLTWLLLALFVVVAMAICVWQSDKFVNKPTVNAAVTTIAPPSTDQLMTELTSTVDAVDSVLKTVINEPTAQKAIPALDDATKIVIKMGLDRLPDSHRATMTEAAKPLALRLVATLKQVYKTPGVQAFIEPAISPMLSRLQAFANLSAE